MDVAFSGLQMRDIMKQETKPINNGGPAFPVQANGVEQILIHVGMSIRDWFAGQETLSDYDHPDSWNQYNALLEAFNGAKPEDKAKHFARENEARAKVKLARADAMLTAREVKL